jgi:hypothetical protein
VLDEPLTKLSPNRLATKEGGSKPVTALGQVTVCRPRSRQPRGVKRSHEIAGARGDRVQPPDLGDERPHLVCRVTAPGRPVAWTRKYLRLDLRPYFFQPETPGRRIPRPSLATSGSPGVTEPAVVVI